MRRIGRAVVLAVSFVLAPIAARSQTARTYRVAMLEPPRSQEIGVIAQLPCFGTARQHGRVVSPVGVTHLPNTTPHTDLPP
jgi:hypothetical protein